MVKKTHLLILGGGFAGIKLLRQLRYQSNLDITLITNSHTFRYGATVWRAATGFRKDDSYIPIEGLIGIYPNLTIIYDEAVSIDRKKQLVKSKSGKILNYDYCAIGLGMVTTYFGIDGLEKYSYSIKSSRGLDKLRKHLHQQIVSDSVLDENYVVVGAGPTGVELSAALKSYLKFIARNHKIKHPKVNIELIEAADRVLPTMPKVAGLRTHKRLRKLGVRVMTSKHVKSESEKYLVVDKRRIPTQTVVWTAGVTNNPFFFANGDQFTLNDHNRVVTDGYLRVDPHVFVMGDNAATPYSGLALTAVHNARYVAKVITRELDNKIIRPYKPIFPITIIPIGEGWAVLQWKSLILTGRFASYLRSVLDVVGYAYVMGYPKTWQLWQHHNDREEMCKICQKSQLGL